MVWYEEIYQCIISYRYQVTFFGLPGICLESKYIIYLQFQSGMTNESKINTIWLLQM